MEDWKGALLGLGRTVLAGAVSGGLGEVRRAVKRGEAKLAELQDQIAGAGDEPEPAPPQPVVIDAEIVDEVPRPKPARRRRS